MCSDKRKNLRNICTRHFLSYLHLFCL